MMVRRWTDEQQQGIWESAGHWLGNWENPHEAVTGARGCPLCKKYGNAFLRDETTCCGCPVLEHTRLDRCQGTPWLRAHLDVAAVQNDGGGGGRMEKAKESAEAEYRFLVELALSDLPSK